MGPIVWIYIPEILQEEALALAVTMNQFGNFVLSMVPLLIPSHYRPIMIFVFAGFTLFTLVIIYFYMQETQGKTYKEIYKQFIKDVRYSNEEFGLKFFENVPT